MSNALIAVPAEEATNELWWLWAIQATLALFFGITALFWPGLTLLGLVYLFSAFILGLGLIELIHGLVSVRRRSTWWLTLLIGIAGIVAGVYLVRHPKVSFGSFILIIGLLFIGRGLLDIIRAFTDRLPFVGKILVTLIGVGALIAGILIMMQPVTGGVAFVWILGLYSFLFGTIGLAMAFELRNAWLSNTPSTATQGKENRGANTVRV